MAAKAKSKTSTRKSSKTSTAARKATRTRTTGKKAPAGKRGSKSSTRRAPAGSKSVKGAAAGEIQAINLSPEDKRFIANHKSKLSRSTLRAKWLQSPKEHEDRPGQVLATRKHEVIKQWAEERRAEPATPPNTKKYGGSASVLRFDFPGYGGRKLEELSWDDWFKTFDRRKLVFIFQEHKADGKQSNFFRFDSPTRQEA